MLKHIVLLVVICGISYGVIRVMGRIKNGHWGKYSKGND